MKRPIKKRRVDTRPRTNIVPQSPAPAIDPAVAALASRIVGGYEPTKQEISTMAEEIFAKSPSRGRALGVQG